MGTLSGGQRRRVDVAVGIVGDPELIFLDEPTTGFDPAARRSAWAMIDGRALGKTILLTTHYMEEAQRLAGRIGILRAGELVASGSVDEIGAGLSADALIRFRFPPGRAGGHRRAGGLADGRQATTSRSSARRPPAGPVPADELGGA